MSAGVGRIAAERSQRVLLELVSKPGNDICADCKARAPRWASYNLGIFICMNCASIHRKIGTHVTKVKSITLDEWSKDQVEVMKGNGNVKSNALYNPNESRHPPPTNMVDSERDSELERFIRSKYEFRRFMDRRSGTVAQHPSAETPMRGASFVRLRSAPLADAAKLNQTEPRPPSPGPPPPPKTPENMPRGLRYSATVPSLPSLPPPARSASQPLLPRTSFEKLSVAPPQSSTSVSTHAAGQVWQDLISLQEPSQSSSLPLQYTPANPMTTSAAQPVLAAHAQPATPSAPNPFLNLSFATSSQTHAPPTLVASPSTSLSIPGPAFPFVPSVAPVPGPLSSPALHLGATTVNPFSQAFAASSFSTSGLTTNPFAPSSSSIPSMGMGTPMSVSTPATPSLQPVMALSTGTPGTPVFPTATGMGTTTPFGAPVGLVYQPAQYSHPFTTPPPLSAMVTGGRIAAPTTNPFATAMQMGQTGYLTGTTPPSLQVQQQQQQQPLPPFGAWAGQGVQGTF